MEFKFTDPAADFSGGFNVLDDYHQDFLNRGKQLVALANTIKKQGMSEDLANQCMDMYCYYSHANHLHHKDEEEALFPLLVNQSSLIVGMIERLMLDHEDIEKAWDDLAERLSKPEEITNVDHFHHLVVTFEKVHREHLIREDEDFFPKIKDILSAEQIAQAGKKMSVLRHLSV